MNVRPLLLTTALVAGLACPAAFAVTWVAPRDFAVPVRDTSPAPLVREQPAVTLKLTVGAAGPRQLADDVAPVRHDGDTAEPPAELAKH